MIGERENSEPHSSGVTTDSDHHLKHHSHSHNHNNSLVRTSHFWSLCSDDSAILIPAVDCCSSKFIQGCLACAISNCIRHYIMGCYELWIPVGYAIIFSYINKVPFILESFMRSAAVDRRHAVWVKAFRGFVSVRWLATFLDSPCVIFVSD